jgi:plasmid stabilization system protein ParE
MAELIVTTTAEAEFDEARAYYRRDSPTVADDFVTEVEQALVLIAENPERWPPDEDDDRYRFFVLKDHSYVIYYRMVNPQKVRVVAFSHSSRLPGYWRGR